MKRIDHLRDIISRYGTLLVDVYGVLHDGGDIFPHATEAMREARRQGATIIILTNSTDRADVVAARLADRGFGPDCFNHVVSSGELTWRYLSALAPGSGNLPKLRLLENAPWPKWVEHLHNPIVDNAVDADAVVAIRLIFNDDEGYARTGIAEELETAKEKRLPMIVADSDETFPHHSSIKLGPGWLARRYREMGGPTIEFGKPYAPAYREAMRLAGDPDPTSVLMIGDNLLTDIAGAKAAGLDSLLVIQHGVHASMSLEAVEAHSRTLGTTPDWVTPYLRWTA